MRLPPRGAHPLENAIAAAVPAALPLGGADPSSEKSKQIKLLRPAPRSLAGMAKLFLRSRNPN
ncbi:MAG: hypothetical protein WDM86_08950 [Rhizomicrobium sp.]